MTAFQVEAERDAKISAYIIKEKNRLARAIERELKRAGFSRRKAAKLFGITTYELGLLRRNLAARFSLEELLEFLRRLGFDVTLIISAGETDEPIEIPI